MSKNKKDQKKSKIENIKTQQSKKNVPKKKEKSNQKGKIKNTKTEKTIPSPKAGQDKSTIESNKIETEKTIPSPKAGQDKSTIESNKIETEKIIPSPKAGQDKSTIESNKIETSINIPSPKTGQDKSTIENNKKELKVMKPSSLMNIGANCYLNSALQGISSCDIFLKELTQLHKKYDNLEKISLFHKLIDILNGGKFNSLEISRNPIFRNWNKSGQQDSFELLAYVMNQVYNEIRKDLENNGKIPKRNMQKWLEEELPMRIIIKYEIRCSCNNVVEVPLQSDLALHVAVPSNNSSDLQTLVEQFFKEDDIEDYECDNESCDGKGARRSTRLLQPLPRTLCIHLQRTFWNGWKMQKIDNYIQFPQMLQINSGFTVSNYNKIDNEVINQNDKNILDKSEITDDDQSQKININHSFNEKCSVALSENDFPQNSIHIEKSHKSQSKFIDEDYYLTSIIVHYGSVYGGHYVCYKKMNGKWFLTNDSSVRQVTDKEVSNCQAYILFYEKL